MKPGKYDYSFTENWGPFGDCPTTIHYDIKHSPYRDDNGKFEAPEVIITGGTFYYNGNLWDVDREAALNCLGGEPELFCLESYESECRAVVE